MFLILPALGTVLLTLPKYTRMFQISVLFHVSFPLLDVPVPHFVHLEVADNSDYPLLQEVQRALKFLSCATLYLGTVIPMPV